jgi:hypothetical protein
MTVEIGHQFRYNITYTNQQSALARRGNFRSLLSLPAVAGRGGRGVEAQLKNSFTGGRLSVL